MQIRRRGRHTSPSQVEKVAAQAGKAAPAVAIAGALVAVPQAQQALAATSAAGVAAAAGTGAHQAAHEAAATAKLTAAHVAGAASAQGRDPGQASRTYTVRSGDTLSAIAARVYHNPGQWQAIYRANAGKISNPNAIYAGERLSIPVNPSAVPAAYQPKHAKPTGATVTETKSSQAGKPSGTSSENATHRVGGRTTTQAAPKPPAHKPPAHKTTSIPSGTLSCSGLERLWDAAGGNPAHAVIAAEIAMAESGGRQYAHSPTNDYGYWQINGVHGPSMATYNPLGNARAAISISGDGTHWSAWTTYTSGAYRGRC
jgi:LysM repeat protein